jgi:hypothetical protein
MRAPLAAPISKASRRATASQGKSSAMNPIVNSRASGIAA